MDILIIIIMLAVFCCCCLLISSSAFFYTKSSSSKPGSSNNTSVPASRSNATTPAPTTPAPTTPAPTTPAPTTPATTPIPALPTYIEAGGDKWGAGERGGEYTCPGANGRNVTSDGGNFNNYCIFNNETDAKAWCSSDPVCLGYIHDKTRNTFMATKKPIANPTMNSAFNIKILPTAPAISYLDTGAGWWGGDGPGVFTCPGARGRNITGDGGNFNNYCIFNNETDAKEWCSSNADCKSIIKDNNPDRSIVSAIKQPVLNPGFNSSHFVKLVK
jgi:hypothetical protein